MSDAVMLAEAASRLEIETDFYVVNRGDHVRVDVNPDSNAQIIVTVDPDVAGQLVVMLYKNGFKLFEEDAETFSNLSSLVTSVNLLVKENF